MWLLPYGAAHAFSYDWSAQSDKERLVLSFDGQVPRHALERTQETQLRLLLPDGYWQEHERPADTVFGESQLVESLTITDDGAYITLRTNGFGYIRMVQDNRIILDVFADPMGARWEPEMGVTPSLVQDDTQAGQEPEREPVPEAAQPEAMSEVQPPEILLPVAETPTPEANATEPESEPAPEGDATVQEPPAEETAIQAEPDPGSQPGHVLLAPFQIVGPGEAVPISPSAQPSPSLPPVVESQPEPPMELPEVVQPEIQPEPTAPEVPMPDQATPEPPELAQPDAPPPEEPVAPEPQVAETEQPAVPEPLPLPQMPEETPAPSGSEELERQHVVLAPFRNVGIEESVPINSGTPPPATSPAPDSAQVQPPDSGQQPPADSGVEPPADGVDTPPLADATDTPPDAGEGEGDQPRLLTTEELLEFADRLQNPPAEGEEVVEEGGESMPDFEDALMGARLAMSNEDYDVAMEALEGMAFHPLLPDSLLEEISYLLADSYYQVYRDDLSTAYEKIMDAYERAISVSDAMSVKLGEPSPFSYRIPEALLRLAMVNLAVDKFPMAEAYFNILRQDHPNDETIPAAYYYLGKYYLDKGNYQEAADNFDIVVQKYPDNRMVRPAALGLAETLDKLGYIDQAVEIIDFIEQRWPRFYEEDPTFLTVSGSIHFKAGNLEVARDRYWTYYNIMPQAPDADIVLARLGDIYLRSDPPLIEAATEVYTRAATLYPDSEGGLISQMRLAENGVLDNPDTQDMFSVFDQPFTETPAQVYRRIVTEYPDSMLAPLAQLKLAMWHLYNGRTADAIEAVEMFDRRYSQSPLMPNAQATALEAFSQSVDAFLPMEDYRRLVDLWNGSEVLQGQEENLEPQDRIALALSYWKSGYPEMALYIVDALFRRQGMPEDSEAALTLALNVMLDSHDWQGIVELARRVSHWELSEDAEREFIYSQALAYENLNLPEMSRPLWTQLSQYVDTEPSVRAYTLYFLALEAREQSRLKEAYENAQSALSLFEELGIDENKVKDLLILLADITETANRNQEALKWTQEYAAYVDESDPAWPALRYRMARLYKKAAETGKWREILEDLSTRMPDSLYGRMAASELNSYDLEVQAQEFIPPSSL